MLDIFIELCQIYAETFSWDGEIKPKSQEQQITDTIGLWMFSFIFGCGIGLLYCEYLADMPKEIRPISVFWWNVTHELSVHHHR